MSKCNEDSDGESEITFLYYYNNIERKETWRENDNNKIKPKGFQHWLRTKWKNLHLLIGSMSYQGKDIQWQSCCVEAVWVGKEQGRKNNNNAQLNNTMQNR